MKTPQNKNRNTHRGLRGRRQRENRGWGCGGGGGVCETSSSQGTRAVAPLDTKSPSDCWHGWHGTQSHWTDTRTNGEQKLNFNVRHSQNFVPDVFRTRGPPQWNLAGYQAIRDWFGFLQSWERGDGEPWKGIPPPLPGDFPLTYTPVPLGYHCTSRPSTVCLWPWSLESPRKCIPIPAVNDHITQGPSGVCGPSAELQDYIVAFGKGTKTDLMCMNAAALFSLFLISLSAEFD